MSGVAVAIAGAAVIGAVVSDQSSKRSTRAQTRAGQAGIAAQEGAQGEFVQRTQPFADVGLAAAPALAELLGLRLPDPQIAKLQSDLAAIDAQIAAGPPVVEQQAAQQVERARKGKGKFGKFFTSPSRRLLGRSESSIGGRIGAEIDKSALPGAAPSTFNLEDLQSQRAGIASQLEAIQTAQPTSPLQTLGAQQQIEEINPVLSFLRDEGFEDIQNLAAARGRLGAGGTLEDLTQFNTQLAGTLVPQLQQQRFNQLFNVLGLGSNAASGQATAALQTGTNISNLQGNIGQARAQGFQDRSENQRELLENLSGSFGSFLENRTPPPPVIPQQVGGTQNPNQFEAFV